MNDEARKYDDALKARNGLKQRVLCGLEGMSWPQPEIARACSGIYRMKT